MRIYVAGPYSVGNKNINVVKAIDAGDEIARKGHIPFIPHLTHFWDILHQHKYEFWMKQDIAWLLLCQALLRLPGESPGADQEEELAKAAGLIVYHDVNEIPVRSYE